ncbi:hypothetical protein CI109_103216 [Kwoniella shandongensis]|uniref:Uncharacterized protein n=1 Tax=Kwoniella shandongensis TaxID=1734106 RepID=A0A5M6C965_9TREE|nr:uncharacterized protein CI109_000406 [Kwoniella shandongensis]KAA5531563.1 hypothetical protein CI109_000406 [Kwoniella shandongensis]
MSKAPSPQPEAGPSSSLLSSLPSRPSSSPSSSSSLPPPEPQPHAQAQPSEPLPTVSGQLRRMRRDLLHPEKSYVGPDISTLDPPRSRSQAEKYFARVANENALPSRTSKLLGVGGWVLGGFACVYMTLWADFGEREHVFSPVRRQYAILKNSFFTLSPREREMMGLEERKAELLADAAEEQRPA